MASVSDVVVFIHGIRLPRICRKQRMLKKAMGKRQPSLRQDRFELLNKLVDEGKFTWAFGLGYDQRWQKYYEALTNHSVWFMNGNCNIPKSETILMEDGENLAIGYWLYNQREKYRSGRLKENRFQLLQKLVDCGRLKWENDDEFSALPVGHLNASADSSDSFLTTDLLKDANDLEMLRFLNDNDYEGSNLSNEDTYSDDYLII